MIRVIQKAEQEGENTPVQVSVVNGSLNVNNLFKDGAADAFGRQRISEQHTLADYTHVYGEETELLTKVNGSGSSITFNTNQAKAILTVDGGTGDYVIHQSRMYHHYMAGKSQLTFQSFNFKNYNSGTNKRIGLFDHYNGIYFQQSGDGSLAFVLRSDVSGNVQDTIIPQSGWNKDKCDGTGPSLFNLDPTKTQLFTSDFQWLGVGRVRAGFVHDGNIIIAHEFYNSNNKDTVYWSNPNLPVRCEIRNYSATTGTNSMDQICATIISEGGYKEAGVDFAVGNTGYRSIVAQATLPVLAIRLKTGFYGKPNRSIVRLDATDLYSESQLCSYDIWRLPSGASLIGGTWQDNGINDSVVEYNMTATGYNTNGGNRIFAGFLPAGGAGVGNIARGSANISNVSDAKRGYLSQNIDTNDSNIFVVILKNFAAIGPSNATNVLAAMQWRETR